MTRHLVGLGCAAWFLGALGVVGCSGGNSNAPPLDGGVTDATLSDADDNDATTTGSEDAGEDAGGPCKNVDGGKFTDAEVQGGYAIVVAMKCQSCHGAELAGNAQGIKSDNAEGGVAYPENLTPDPTTGIGCWSAGEIKHAFLDGTDRAGRPMCDPMPKFADEGDGGISAANADLVIAYLRNIPAVVNAVPENPACPYPPEDAGSESDASTPVDAGQDATVADAGDAAPGDAGDAD
jgi:hypothetical protein